MTFDASAFYYAVVKGECDEHLDNIIAWARDRKHSLSLVNVIGIKPGDEVRFSTTIRPKYLVGLTATVVKINPQSIVVSCPDDPAYGRFQGGSKVKCHKSLIAGAA